MQNDSDLYLDNREAAVGLRARRLQPNLNIPLYLVAPDDRRQKVIDEVNRPTFCRLSPPLFEVCRFISFSALRVRLKEAGPLVRYLKPEFLEELSESCEIEEA